MAPDQVAQGGWGRRLRPIAVTPALAAFLASSRVRDAPHGAYRLLRRLDAVHRSPFGFWVLSRHADVAAALRHPDMGTEMANMDLDLLRLGPLRRVVGGVPDRPGPFLDVSRDLMLFRDPPDHTRLRGLVGRAFTPRRMRALEDRISALTDEILATLRHRDGFDLMAELAYPLPARVICELIGLPAGDHRLIAEHGRALAVGLDPLPTAADLAGADDAVVALRAHLAEPLSSRPTSPRDDLLSDLVAVADDGDALSAEELVATVVLLLIAGHETTANLIGGAVAALDDHPDLRRELADREVVAERAVEELLRVEPPVQMTQRIALAPIDVGGHRIPTGSLLVLLLGAANRDPTVFPAPDSIDLDRSPNPHLSFGAGAHYCLGAALARLEGRIVLPALYRSLPDLRVRRPAPRHRSSFTVRGYSHLPVVQGPGTQPGDGGGQRRQRRAAGGAWSSLLGRGR